MRYSVFENGGCGDRGFFTTKAQRWMVNGSREWGMVNGGWDMRRFAALTSDGLRTEKNTRYLRPSRTPLTRIIYSFNHSMTGTVTPPPSQSAIIFSSNINLTPSSIRPAFRRLYGLPKRNYADRLYTSYRWAAEGV